ncbi:MAG: cob(I)yrinic acid a,c-diamide adenosyltransferase [Ignavibacteria bacterium]|jgi:cob(I)alamin adenosyltransferase|nr:cob(I)yrinic acid a,c-diamide adenosyltransferase [Ignavibacteria bacterium]MDH7528399.1 cob(I)yrinic acid a,c-diamide adenosyltransferase [Ignavibacteria bacterium]NPV10500.1 cob(I)yrinic acid a,c-diamide adenosyltransferase [Ignavibacteria bacterium]
MKIYTKTGDDGTTGLFGGKRVLKDDDRVETYGEIDELNSLIGLALSFVLSNDVKNDLKLIQNQLFNIGAFLATPVEDRTKLQYLKNISDEDVVYIEKRIDYYDEKLPELKNFILPGGTKSAGFLHFARTVCRRCERKIVKFALKEEADKIYIKFFNRLSDFLFVIARYENHFAGFDEVEWKK